MATATASTKAKSSKGKRLVRKTASPRRAVAPAEDRPEQVVITMDDKLKRDLLAKCKRDKVPMAKVGRILLASWVGADHVKLSLVKNQARA